MIRKIWLTYRYRRRKGDGRRMAIEFPLRIALGWHKPPLSKES